VSLVRAAGGLVVREGAAGLEVVLVHRASYDDWSFPKGKLDPGEGERTCAVREVDEECGLHCELEDDLGAIAYEDGQGRPKVVRYWRMRAPVGAEAWPAHEIDDARWVPLSEAEPMLTYPHDRTLLRRLAGDPPLGPPVPVYLLRHVKAGERGSSKGLDELRPISRTGLKQAWKLAGSFAGLGIVRIASSPSLRCLQSVDPMAETIGVDVDVADELFEGRPIEGAEALALWAAAVGPAVLCTHGDIMQGLVESLIARGVPVGGDGTVAYRKGAAWRLNVADGLVRKMTYVPPPTGPRPPVGSGFVI